MSRSLAQPSLPTPLLCSEKRAKTAKATLRKPENTNVLLGLCIEDVQTELRLSLEEFAHALGKDERQVKRWQTAEERPQVEAVFAIERFQVALIVAMAKRIGNAVEVETVIRVRRSA